MFSVKNGKVEVYETSSAFYIRNTQNGIVRGMGDGVDMFSDEDGNSIAVGTKRFYTELRKMVRNEKAVLIEAYGLEDKD